MDKIAEFLGGEGNRETIDWNYEKALKKAGEDRAKSVEQAWYDTDLYNKNKDYFDSIGIDRPTSAAEVSSVWGKEMDALEKERKRAWEQNKYNIAGNGIIGGILNPVAQTASLAGDMFASPFRAMAGEETNRYKRDKENDVLSDIGATLETAMLLGGLGSRGVARGTSSLGKAALKGAAAGAGYGAASSLREMGAKNFDLGNLALSTGINAGVGGGLAGLGGLWNKYSTSIDKDAVSKRLSEYAKGAREYQDKLNILKNEGLAGNKEELSKAFDVWSKARENHPNSVSIPRLLGDGNTQVSKAEAENIYQQLVEQAMKERTDRLNKVTNAFNYVKEKELPSLDLSSIPRKKASSISEGLSNIKNNLFTTNHNGRLSKATTKVSSLLKTKKGKIGAGLGGGLLLSKLMSGNKDQKTLTNDELQQLLYNYNYGGQ